ncbi:MAG: aminotransferase class I/II-fold pyridoxal phosphate-dependent enzyme [Parachlamydia sp.]|nr:aminotransferase class I/II-fold pyridoxal phosphate-dependent enzyme [Parachlamydia sp.]
MIDPFSAYVPTTRDLIYIRPAEPEWYLPGIDPICHQRELFMTRGMYLLNEWWVDQHFRVSYDISELASYGVKASVELEEAIYALHETTAPVQKIRDCYIVIGTGATQIINAALYAVSVINCLRHEIQTGSVIPITPLYLTQKSPGYFEIKDAIHLLHPNRIFWVDMEKVGTVKSDQLLEYVTTPNNPNGEIRPTLTNAAYTIHDRVNHWRLFLNEDDSPVNIDTLAEDMISIFSMSKFLSFSGSRVGYAFVKNEKIMLYMRHYIISVSHGLNSDGQFHCLKALEYLLDGHLDDFVETTRNRLQARWEELRSIIGNTPLKLLNEQGPAAWIQTPEKAQNYLLKKYHFIGTYGPEYGSAENHVRINMLSKTTEFNEFIWRLKNL